MTNPYGPWATAINAGGSAQLNAFWRQRLTMLVPTSQTSSVLSWCNLLGLVAAAALACALPTFHAAPVVAEQEKPTDGKGNANMTQPGDATKKAWEWCQDGYYKESPVDDPTGRGLKRVCHGAGWGDHASNCRSASRAGSTPGIRSDDLGFRVARVPAEAVAETRSSSANDQPGKTSIAKPNVAPQARPPQSGGVVTVIFKNGPDNLR